MYLNVTYIQIRVSQYWGLTESWRKMKVDWPHGKWDMYSIVFFFICTPHLLWRAGFWCHSKMYGTGHSIYWYNVPLIIVRVLNGSTVILKFIGQRTNAANGSIHLEIIIIIIIIMLVRIIALLFFSCKETKREIKDLFQVYTFWPHWYFLPYFKGMLCYS